MNTCFSTDLIGFVQYKLRQVSESGSEDDPTNSRTKGGIHGTDTIWKKLNHFRRNFRPHGSFCVINSKVSRRLFGCRMVLLSVVCHVAALFRKPLIAGKWWALIMCPSLSVVTSLVVSHYSPLLSNIYQKRTNVIVKMRYFLYIIQLSYKFLLNSGYKWKEYRSVTSVSCNVDRDTFASEFFASARMTILIGLSFNIFWWPLKFAERHVLHFDDVPSPFLNNGCTFYHREAVPKQWVYAQHSFLR